MNPFEGFITDFQPESLVALVMLPSDTSTEMSNAGEDTVITEPTTPFRFLDLPTEIQSRIIKITLDIERKAFRSHETPNDPLDTASPKFYDFNISAYSLRCHSLPPFGLLFVNKYVSGEALAVVYQNSAFVVYAEISRTGVPDEAFGYIPKMVKYITPMMKTNAREVTFNISTIDEGPKASYSPPNNAVTLMRALENLQLLVGTATFPNVKTLNVVLQADGLVQKHLNVILELFAVSGCIVQLEEVCDSRFGDQQDEVTFGEMVQKAAKAAGQEWVLTEKPNLESKVNRDVWRGKRVIWARRRIWNRVFASSGAAPAQL
jgi:hypothetical protein